MTDKVGEIAKEQDPINKGILISAIVIFAGLIPEIEIGSVKVLPTDSLLLLLGGFSSLFYFISIKINQSEHVDEKGFVWTKTPILKSSLSKEIQTLSRFILVLFIIRGGYLFIRSLID